jgi:hypothetical protein
MSGYVSYGPYSLGPNLTYKEKVEMITRMCKSGLWSKSDCEKYIEELEKEKRFLQTSLKNAQAISSAIGRATPSSNLEGNLDKARRQEEARRAAEDTYWESELEKEFAKLDRENPKSCKKDKDGKCTIMGGLKRKSRKVKNTKRMKRFKKATKKRRY